MNKWFRVVKFRIRNDGWNAMKITDFEQSIKKGTGKSGSEWGKRAQPARVRTDFCSVVSFQDVCVVASGFWRCGGNNNSHVCEFVSVCVCVRRSREQFMAFWQKTTSKTNKPKRSARCKQNKQKSAKKKTRTNKDKCSIAARQTIHPKRPVKTFQCKNIKTVTNWICILCFWHQVPQTSCCGRNWKIQQKCKKGNKQTFL